MHVLAALLTCSLYADDALVRAIARRADDNAFAVIDPALAPDVDPTEPAPRTLEAAALRVHNIAAYGRTALVGVMQVPVAWGASFGREEKELFDPCVNVSIGTAMLSSFAYACARTKRQEPHPRALAARSLRTCVLRRYAEAIGTPDLESAVAETLRYEPPAPRLPTDAPILGSASDRPRWGASCILLPPAPSVPAGLRDPLPNERPASKPAAR